MYGEYVVTFHYDMAFPEGVLEWTSENVGAEYFEATYLPSAESQTFFEEADIDVERGWQVIDADINSITMRLNFTHPLAVSTSPYDGDSFLFSLKQAKKEEFTVVDENRPLKWEAKPVRLNLVQQIGDSQTKEILQTL